VGEPVSALPQATREAALAKVKAREDGIRAQAIRQGREAERKDMLQALGIQRIEEASQLAQLRAERDARPTVGEEAKHGRHQRWLGFAIGVPVGMILACAAIFAMQGIIWDTATRSFREQAMTGAIISSQGEGERNEGYTNPGQDVTRRP
jgi:hypothetical protein